MKKKGRSSATAGRYEVVIRTINVSDKLYWRSLEEVLADPVPFPKFKKVASNKKVASKEGKAESSSNECKTRTAKE